VFAESQGYETGRWQEVAGQDCIRIVVDALRSSVVHNQMITQDDIKKKKNTSSDLQHTQASTMLLAKLCQNAFSASQVVAAGGTLVFLQVLSTLPLLLLLEADFMDLTCPQIVIPVCEALRNTVSIDGQHHHGIVLPVILEIIQNTPVYCSSGLGLGLLVGLEKSSLDRGSPLVCVVRDTTRVCLDIVGWAPRVLKDAKVFLAHFYIVTTVTKTDTDTISRFLVLNAS
jgi:hypothetical protein